MAINIFYKCPVCSAPNISKLKCEYCNSIMNNSNEIEESSIDKNKFDFAINEFRRKKYDKSLEIFDDIIQYDSKNKVAWLYKYASELGIKFQLDEFVNDLSQHKLNDLCDLYSDDILNVLKNVLNHHDIDDGYIYFEDFNFPKFILFIESLSDSFKLRFLKIYSTRFSPAKELKIRISNQLLSEIENLVLNENILNIDLKITEEIIDSFISLSYEYLNENLILIKNVEEMHVHLSKRLSREKNENYIYTAYIKDDFFNRIISVFQSIEKNKGLSGIDFAKHIEKCKNINTQIVNINTDLDSELLNMIKKGESLNAVKHKKENSSLSLAESKAYVDKLASENGLNKTEGCFIATACFGNYESEEVIEFRTYRDNILLKSKIGRLLVSTYYFISPPIASLISKSDISKRVIRRHILMPALHLIRRNY